MSKKLKRLFSKNRKQKPSDSLAKGFHIDSDQKTLLMTMTNEPFQFARIHYNLLKKNELEKIFSKLKCIDYDPGNKRWVWLYYAEAKILKFKKSYNDIPQKFHPIVIGSFFMPTNDRMYLDVNSFDRAIIAIQFFDKFINRNILFLSHIQVVNKLFEAVPGIIPKPNEYFDSDCPNKPNENSPLDALVEDETLDQSKKQSLAFQYIEDEAKKPIEQVESLPVHFYEDGIEGLEGCLKMRHVIAYEHWRGNKNYSFNDLIQKMFSGS